MENNKCFTCVDCSDKKCFYCRASRVEETIRWAKKLGAKKQLL